MLYLTAVGETHIEDSIKHIVLMNEQQNNTKRVGAFVASFVGVLNNQKQWVGRYHLLPWPMSFK